MATAADRSPIEVLDERAAPPTRTTSYGRDDAQVYDVRLPQRVTRSLTVVVVHGGFWREQYDRAHTNPLAEALAESRLGEAEDLEIRADATEQEAEAERRRLELQADAADQRAAQLRAQTEK